MNVYQQFKYDHEGILIMLVTLLIIGMIGIITVLGIGHLNSLEIDFFDTLSCSQILNKINLSGEHRHESVIDYYVNRCVN